MVSFHPKDVERMFEVNVQGTASVVNWALENEVPVCHVSSIAAIGSPMQDGIADEQCIWHDDKTHTQYSRSKFYSEMEVWRAMEEGLNAVIVNPGVVIGCGDGQSSSGLLFKTISRNLKLYPMGAAGYIGAVDLARGMVALMLQKKWGERFIVVSDNLTMKEVFGMIAESLGLAKPHIPTRPFVLNAVRLFEWIKEVFTGTPSVVTTDTVKNTGKHRKFSSEKWKKTLGWEFEPIAKVIQEAGAFYKNNNVNKK
jgi:nucleoside-diphosphate-sugar epimerase